MAYIEKRRLSNGKFTYRVRIRQAGAPKKSASFATRARAKKWAQRMEADVREGRYFGREESRERTFAEFIDRYIAIVLPKNPKSYAKQKMQLAWWKARLGDYFLCHITPAMIAESRDLLMNEVTRRKRFRTPSTTNRYLAALSRAYTICVREWQWVRENPVQKIIRPKENKPRDRYLDREEVQRLLQACQKSKNPYLHSIITFALGTGARKSEILGLKWADVDFDRCTAIFRDTKNGESRVIHLSEPVVRSLRDQFKRPKIKSEYVFPSMDGKQPADIRGAWERAVQDAELKNVCFHSLRHTAASHLAMGGASILEIGKILGHKTLACVKIYSHLSTASTSQPLERMNKAILGESNLG